jgi:sorbitol/mannitol transport system substrate-binding protein
MQKASKHSADAWKFISWASGKDYEALVGAKVGWASVPAGKRASLYANPEYQKAAAAFYQQTQTAISSADPRNPGVQARPTIGIQFVDIPEFTDFGTASSLAIGSAIAGKESVHSALQTSQGLASAAGKLYQK